MKNLFKFRFWFFILLGLVFLSNLIKSIYNFEDLNNTVIVRTGNFKNKQSIDFYKGNSIVGEFRSNYNNLGIVSVKFNTHGIINTDFLQFRIREKNGDWFYVAKYKVDQFQNNKYFPFGFPEITDSKNKIYEFEIISLGGTEDNFVSIDSGSNQFLIKNSFSKKYLSEHRTYIPIFVFNKVWSFFLNMNLIGFILAIFESIVLFIFLILTNIPMLFLKIIDKNKDENSANERYFWVDLIKGIAIIGVVVDHLSGTAYINTILHRHTIFAVSLFILMAGFTSAISIQKRKIIDFDYIIRRIVKVLVPYSIATVFYGLYHNGYFDFVYTYKNIISFSASEPFYFILFYIELIFISVFLYKIIFHKKSKLLDILIILVTYFVSFFLNKYTKIGKLYGGGGVLFGGSYLFLYVLGFFLKKYEIFFNKTLTKITLFILSVIFLVIFEKSNFVLFSWSNPPNNYLIGYCLTIFLFIFNSYNLFLYKAKKVFKIFYFLGKNSLYIYLYHRLLIMYFSSSFLSVEIIRNNCFLGIFFLLMTTLLPAYIEHILGLPIFIDIKNYFKYPIKT